MPWPAPDLPVNFANATVSQDTHPQAHNSTNLSLNNNYRPELTRVGQAIDGTQSVFTGTNPALNAGIKTDGAVIRETLSGSLSNKMSVYVGTYHQDQPDIGAATTGPTPVPYFDLELSAGDWTRGGYIVITTACTYTRRSPGLTDRYAYLYASYTRNGGALNVNPRPSRVYINPDTSEIVQIINTRTVQIPEGTTALAAVCAVSDNAATSGVLLGDAYLSVDCFSY